MKSLLAVGLLILFISGCSVGPDYVRPTSNVEVELPDSLARLSDSTTASLADTLWWELFGDPVLSSLIDEATENNYDIKIAAERVRQFMGYYGVTKSEYWPRVDLNASGRTGESNENGVTYRDNQFQVNLAASWEIDLWGKVARANEAALADVLASEESRRGVILTIIASVAQSYIDLLSLDEQIRISKSTIDIRERSLGLFNQRLLKGDISELEVRQLESEYWFARAQLPLLEIQRNQLEYALCILLGRGPGGVQRGITIEEMQAPEMPGYIPSVLLERRPDIRNAEEQLISANARIGVVKSLYYPSISLTGLLGFSSNDISKLFNSSSLVWSAGGNLLMPLFNAGQIAGEVEATEAIQRQLLYNYLQTINIAFSDAQSSLIARIQNEDKVFAERQRLDALTSYKSLSQMRYDEGVTSFLEVLDAERNLYTSQLDYIRSKADFLKSSVDIYSALAGGWLDYLAESSTSDEQANTTE